MELIIMVGLPGSGKSTYVKEHYRNYFVVSADSIRGMLRPYHTWDFDNDDDIVINTSHFLLRKLLERNKSCVVDETCIYRRYREFYIKLAHEFNYHVKGIWLDVNPDICIRRRTRDTRGIDAIKRKQLIYLFNQKFEPPSIDEGFNELSIVKINEY